MEETIRVQDHTNFRTAKPRAMSPPPSDQCNGIIEADGCYHWNYPGQWDYCHRWVEGRCISGGILTGGFLRREGSSPSPPCVVEDFARTSLPIFI